MSGQLSFRQNDKIQYAVYMPSGVEDWTIFSMVEKDAAALQYERTISRGEKHADHSCIVCYFACCFDHVDRFTYQKAKTTANGTFLSVS